MQKTSRNLMLCGMVFAVALVVSNIVAAKTVMTGFTLFGSPVVVPSAVVCYFLDLSHDRCGRGALGTQGGCANCEVGFRLPGVCLHPHWRGAASTRGKWGKCKVPTSCCSVRNVVFVIASLLAYLTSQSWDLRIPWHP